MNYEEYLISGREHYDRGDFETAIKCFQSAIEIAPDKAMPYFFLGSVYHKLGDFAQALKCYEDYAKAESKEADT